MNIFEPKIDFTQSGFFYLKKRRIFVSKPVKQIAMVSF